jgi:lipopolysaccharide/colanic/teichoic acid biosynthesis glycosyltransferase
VLVVGVNRLSDFYIQTLEELGDGSVEISGILHDEKRRCAGQIRAIPILGSADDLIKFLHDFDVRGVRIDRIALCCAWQDLNESGHAALLECRGEHNIRIDSIEDHVASLNQLLGFRRTGMSGQPEFGGFNEPERPGVALEIRGKSASAEYAKEEAPLPEISGYFRYKRVFDTLIAAVLILLLLPAMIVVGLLVNLFIGFPGIFWQKRPGRHGKVFKIYKFRSMLPPFDDDGNRIPEELRVTTFCRILRRSRLDELPQLYNILIGHMSLVGPRPLLPIDQPKNAELRLLIRPGVTGWAQVNGGINLTPDEKLALDLWYARHASPWLDLKIMIKSVEMIFRGDRKDDDAVGKAMLEMTNQHIGAVQHG